MAGELLHEDSTEKPFLVVTGSSAGGIDALLALVGGLPADFPAPIVVAQHLHPAHPTHLAEILAQRSPLPVRVVGEREGLAGGAVYIVPPGHDVVVVDGAATTSVETRPGPKPSVDRLFSSAAETYGDGLIAIVFSGMGSDGLAGVRDVKEHGGTVIIQDPRTASHPSMPLAIPPTLVDLTAPPEAMGGLLQELIRGTRTPDGATEQNVMRALLTQLRDRTGIDFLQYKTPTIMRRLSRLMVAAGVENLSEYIRHLQAHPEGYPRLVSAFLIKVTEFFRDAALFDELKNVVLPRLIAEAAQNDNELRIWSAGTSTGEEAYSLAILCAELLRAEHRGVSVRIFATDLDEEAIAFARRGVYGREALRHVPQAWIERYFVQMGDQFEVGKPIRNMTVFGAHDLGQRAPFPRIDLCTCRNVLIYFTRELQTRALQLFAFSLRDGGFLVLGKAESTTPLAEYFPAGESDPQDLPARRQTDPHPAAAHQGYDGQRDADARWDQDRLDAHAVVRAALLGRTAVAQRADRLADRELAARRGRGRPALRHHYPQQRRPGAARHPRCRRRGGPRAPRAPARHDRVARSHRRRLPQRDTAGRACPPPPRTRAAVCAGSGSPRTATATPS